MKLTKSFSWPILPGETSKIGLMTESPYILKINMFNIQVIWLDSQTGNFANFSIFKNANVIEKHSNILDTLF